MGIFRTTLAVTGWGSLAAASGFIAMTRNSKVLPIPASDYIFNSTLYAKHNPQNAPVTQDICVRKVPLDKIKPELLDKEGKLVEAFCAGVWGGIGYAYQRRFLEKKYRADPYTADHLWDSKDLQTSTYEIGTKITDHFEVVSKNADSIIVRCGDSPRKIAPRESDGLFEMLAEVNKEEGQVEFGLKSVFYNSLSGHENPGAGGPMPAHIQWLHGLYDKVLMESAIRNVTK
ncbi:hypothetical protein K431DRAFT_257223 [Polychaeton citri CBS 116435]|uniref:Uncharacterized protein n=1 Tax=Polychaeton citri CBS 116435 TaxID=1314669 RepID=A0A9P4UI84_9PEZI|nr:hypothetical protein K431DRAFT_257223 [Polychaeton citri CBS 116435]